MPPDLCGADFDETPLDALPAGVDPCGEGGEFHSLCWDGPMFRKPIPVLRGQRVERGGHAFTDLLPTEEESCGDGFSAAPSSGGSPLS
jgi:diphthamide synthase (EF-2-diphthine--ammonia ligase)